MENQNVKRAAEMLRIAAKIIRNEANNAVVNYDGADCDGWCVADDCETAADMLMVEMDNEAVRARPQALDDCETHVRQALMDAAYVHRENRDISSGIFKAETYATAAINALRVAD